MSSNYQEAEQNCRGEMLESPEIMHWWWDLKNVTSLGTDITEVCDVWEDYLLEAEEYGHPKDTGTPVAIDSFISQLNLQVGHLCAS